MIWCSSRAAVESWLWQKHRVGEGCGDAKEHVSVLAHWRMSNAEARYRLRVLSLWVWHRDGASDGVSARVAKCYGMYVDLMSAIAYVVGDVLGRMGVRSVYWVGGPGRHNRLRSRDRMDEAARTRVGKEG